MDRRRLLITLFGICPLSTYYLIAKDQGKGKRKGQKNKQEDNDQGGKSGGDETH